MTPPMTTTATLAGLLERATARPWRVFESPYGNDVVAIMKGNQPPRNEKGYHVRRWPEIVAWTGFDGSDVPKRYRRANAELAVAAVNALPALLTRIAALEDALEPFAKEAARIEPKGPAEYRSDDVEIWQSGPDEIRRSRITYGHLRRAALTLKENDDG